MATSPQVPPADSSPPIGTEGSRNATRASDLAVLLRSGVLAPTRPARMARQLSRLRRLGPTLAGAYAGAAARAPHRRAVVDERCTRTFAELDERARGIARGLLALGVRAGDAVAVCGHNSVVFVEALVGISWVGADTVLLSTALSAPQVRDVLAREQPAVIVADPDLLPLLTDTPSAAVVTTAPVPGPDGHTSDRHTLLTLDDLARAGGPGPHPPPRRGRLIVLTSGTSGTPKSARRPAPADLAPAAAMLSRLRLRSRDTVLVASPLFHTWGLGMLQIAPALAATVVLSREADPEQILRTVSGTGCTVLATVPMVLEGILGLPPAVRTVCPTPRLRVVASCGAPLTAEISERFQNAFGEVLYNVYGSTEISWATIATPHDLRVAPGTAGKPPRGTRLLLLDAQGCPTPPGQVGHIFVGNDLMFEGYTGLPATPRRHGLLATGDLGYLDRNGRLTVIGREDDLIISGAEKIYPLEVEQVIAQLPGVREVAVVGRPDDLVGQRLIAYVVCDPGTALTGQHVREHVRARLARFAVPDEVAFLGRLPRTPTGKVVPRLLPPVLLPPG